MRPRDGGGAWAGPRRVPAAGSRETYSAARFVKLIGVSASRDLPGHATRADDLPQYVARPYVKRFSIDGDARVSANSAGTIST